MGRHLTGVRDDRDGALHVNSMCDVGNAGILAAGDGNNMLSRDGDDGALHTDDDSNVPSGSGGAHDVGGSDVPECSGDNTIQVTIVEVSPRTIGMDGGVALSDVLDALTMGDEGDVLAVFNDSSALGVRDNSSDTNGGERGVLNNVQGVVLLGTGPAWIAADPAQTTATFSHRLAPATRRCSCKTGASVGSGRPSPVGSGRRGPIALG
jgi:hypothetical protein